MKSLKVADKRSTLKRLSRDLQFNSISNCLEWQGAKDTGGYGQLTANGKHYSAHRLIYSLVRDEDISNKYICHRCDNRSCCNVLHLYRGDSSTNQKDRFERLKGITEETRSDAARFYTETSLSYRDVADIYSVNAETVRRWVMLYG